MTHAQLGQRVNLTRQTIAAIQASKDSPSRQVASHIAEVFGQRLDEVCQRGADRQRVPCGRIASVSALSHAKSRTPRISSAMHAGAINCPRCGAAVRRDKPNCDYCTARLQTKSCSRCHAMMWFTEQFCSKCGRHGQAVEAGEMLNMHCPRCAVQLRSVAFDHATAGECPKCTGLWIAPTDFEHICHDADQRAVDNGSVLPTAPLPPGVMASKKAEPGPGGVPGGGSMYPPCAVCRQPMAHQNFAQRSGVRINRCRQHGVWLDKGELRTIVDFIRAGGLVLTRAIETENLKRARRDLAQQQRAGEDHSEPPSMWERLFWI